jgi:hypothetical protein
MSAPEADTDHCYPWAETLSCDAMTELAIAEVRRNRGASDYMLVHPACERFQQFADRKAEHDLQKTSTLRKNMCTEKLASYQDGPWKTDQPPTILAPPVTERFVEWTRAKTGVVSGAQDTAAAYAAAAATAAASAALCPPNAPAAVPDFWSPDAGKLLETCAWSYAPPR